MSNFLEACENVGVEPVCVRFHVSPDVYDCLVRLADVNECENVGELLRCVVDDFILNVPD